MTANEQSVAPNKTEEKVRESYLEVYNYIIPVIVRNLYLEDLAPYLDSEHYQDWQRLYSQIATEGEIIEANVEEVEVTVSKGSLSKGLFIGLSLLTSHKTLVNKLAKILLAMEISLITLIILSSFNFSWLTPQGLQPITFLGIPFSFSSYLLLQLLLGLSFGSIAKRLSLHSKKHRKLAKVDSPSMLYYHQEVKSSLLSQLIILAFILGGLVIAGLSIRTVGNPHDTNILFGVIVGFVTTLDWLVIKAVSFDREITAQAQSIIGVFTKAANNINNNE